jgi:hypothetical protein
VKSLQGPSKIEKMQMTKRIRRTVDSVLGPDAFTPDQVMTRLEYKLSGIFTQLPYGFKKDLEKMLHEVMKGR